MQGGLPDFKSLREEPLLHHLFEKRPGRGVPADPEFPALRRLLEQAEAVCLGEGAYILRTGYRQVGMPIPRQI